MMWADASSYAADRDAVSRSDLVRFSAKKSSSCPPSRSAAMGTSNHTQIAVLMQQAWGDFMQRIGHDAPPTLHDLEQYWSDRAASGTHRNMHFISEGLLALAMPCMTRLIEAEVLRQQEALKELQSRWNETSHEAPWSALLADVAKRLEEHVAYCEHIELDKTVSSSDKGDALRLLLELQEEQTRIDAAVREAQLAMLPDIERAVAKVETAQRRLSDHIRCRSQSNGGVLQQHLPSFECTVLSDHANDHWRPVRSAVLFTASELQSRALHEERLIFLASRGRDHSIEPACNLPPDEVEYVHTVLAAAMKETIVSQAMFDLVLSRVMTL